MNLFNNSWGGVAKYLNPEIGTEARILKYEGVDADGVATFSTPASINGDTKTFTPSYSLGGSAGMLQLVSSIFQLIKSIDNMKLKYIFPLFIAILTLMISCADEESVTLLDEIQVSSSYVAIPMKGGSTSITVTAKESWTAEKVTTDKIRSNG